MGRFDGKVAIVTGAASGIGRATAILFAREGAKVVVSTDRNIEVGRETVRAIEEAGGQAIFVRCDVSKAEEVENLVKKTVETYGALHFAFNDAGIGPDGVRVPQVNVSECPNELWERTIGGFVFGKILLPSIFSKV